ncbi:MAG: hypothetical protein ACRCXD_03600 [Luteolibacter sp.]
MKPLPAQNSNLIKTADRAMPSLPSTLAVAPASYSTSNRRASAYPGQRVYPILLFTSTAVAGMFCLMYLTKPFIQASQAVTPQFDSQPGLVKAESAPVNSSIMPDKNRLPGEKSTHTAPRATTSPSSTPFEHTNLRIQHILTAEAPGGHTSRIDLDVPVLYQSRNLRWTAAEVAKARQLLIRLANYQEKSRTLRLEGVELLDSWNHLIENSVPATDLRADSPTLPTNQQDAADMPRPAGLNTTELIQIQPAGK